jgi:hypothetical protein
MAVQAASEIVQESASRGNAIPLEWAGTLLMLILAVALGLGVRYRHMALFDMAPPVWGGLVMGGLLCHASLQHGRARLGYLGLAIFVGLPLVLLPFNFLPAQQEQLPLLVAAGLAGALFASAVRFAWHLRTTMDTVGSYAASIGDGVNRGLSAAITWLHDAMLKWIFSLFLLVFGAAAIFISREQGQDMLLWVGMALICLIGTTGIWVPGVYKRTKPLVGLRHVGQLAFWLSFLAVPFIEPGPSADLPYTAKPSLRVAAMGLGLVIVGVTWFIQKPSIVSRHGRNDRKKPAERGFSLVLLVVGLIMAVAGAESAQRSKLTVSAEVISETNFLGSTRLQPVQDVVALNIKQPLTRVPIYVFSLETSSGKEMLLIPQLYTGYQRNPDDIAMVNAIRAAAKLQTQSFPFHQIERWSK